MKRDLLGRSVDTDRIRGSLFDIGPFPLYFPRGTSKISGEVVEVKSEILQLLDKYKGVSEGICTREKIVTEKGYEAWIYQLERSYIQEAMGPTGKWQDPLEAGSFPRLMTA